MCGIILTMSNGEKPIEKLWKQYQLQKSRGSEGFGFIAWNLQSRKILAYERYQTEEEVYKGLCELQPEANAILFHHRFPTSTENLPELNHPLEIKQKSFKHRYYMAHNGVIRNDDELKTKHESIGLKYRTECKEYKTYKIGKQRYVDREITRFNDSEALGLELARIYEAQAESVNVAGSVAQITLETDKKREYALKLHYSRHGNPLSMVTENGFIMIASEAGKDNLKLDQLFSVDLITQQNSSKDLWIGSYTRSEYPSNTGILPLPKGEELPDEVVGNSPFMPITLEDYIATLDHKEWKHKARSEYGHYRKNAENIIDISEYATTYPDIDMLISDYQDEAEAWEVMRGRAVADKRFVIAGYFMKRSKDCIDEAERLEAELDFITDEKAVEESLRDNYGYNE